MNASLVVRIKKALPLDRSLGEPDMRKLFDTVVSAAQFLASVTVAILTVGVMVLFGYLMKEGLDHWTGWVLFTICTLTGVYFAAKILQFIMSRGFLCELL